MIRKFSKIIVTLIVAALMVFAPFWTFLNFYEYYEVGIRKEIGQYPFGNEGAIAVGGSHYESAKKYSQYVLVEGIIFSLVTLSIYLAFFYKRKYGVMAAALFVGYIFYQSLFKV